MYTIEEAGAVAMACLYALVCRRSISADIVVVPAIARVSDKCAMVYRYGDLFHAVFLWLVGKS